ncbi:MAG: 4-hydroxythreonine-4-phosphate dehydrogenase PdxA, partial [Sphingomicrobium sp.]
MFQPPPSPIAVSLGDPAGIGPEVIAKCWDNRADFGLPTFVAVGDPRSIAAVWDGPVEVISDLGQSERVFDHSLPLLHLAAAQPDTPGHP